jgi:2,3-bisphosphoglycerate-dependent phosphoglycerate mutase
MSRFGILWIGRHERFGDVWWPLYAFSSKKRTMIEELFVIRHAQPDRAARIQYNVEPGPPLTALGKMEARQTAAWLEAHDVEYVFSSPFARTMETADTIVDQLGLPISYVKALAEGGPGEGETRVRERVAELLSQLDNGPLRRVAFVTHGVCIKMLLQHTTDNAIDLRTHVYDYGNCSPTAGVWHGVRRDGVWQWELLFRPTQATPMGAPALAGQC